MLGITAAVQTAVVAGGGIERAQPWGREDAGEEGECRLVASGRGDMG